VLLGAGEDVEISRCIALLDGGVISALADSSLVALLTGPDLRVSSGVSIAGSGGLLAMRSSSLGQTLKASVTIKGGVTLQNGTAAVRGGLVRVRQSRLSISDGPIL